MMVTKATLRPSGMRKSWLDFVKKNLTLHNYIFKMGTFFGTPYINSRTQHYVFCKPILWPLLYDFDSILPPAFYSNIALTKEKYV